MSLTRPPYPQPRPWARFYATLDVCPRCHADYESVLHQSCEYEQQAQELREGSCDRITCTKPSTQLRIRTAGKVQAAASELATR